MAANPNRSRYMDKDGVPSFRDSAVYQDPKQMAGGQFKYVAEALRLTGTGAGGVGFTTAIIPFDPAEIEYMAPDGATPHFRRIMITPDGTKTSVNTITGAAGLAADVVLNADGTLTFPTAIAPDGRVAQVIVRGYRKGDVGI